jgi:hypothetical protein
MGIILTVLAITVIVALVALLVLLRIGIRRQERAGCLGCQPPGLSAALTRHLAGLYVRQPEDGTCPAAQAGAEPPLVPDNSESTAS